MAILRTKKFALLSDSASIKEEDSSKFSFHLKKYIDAKKSNLAIKKLREKINQIQEIRKNYKAVDDLSKLRFTFQKRLERGESLDEILPEAYAVVLEAVSRIKKGIDGKPIELTDSQIMTSLVLNDGNIAELATGEGKTYALIMAAYLNTLGGEQVHVFTANDYLAQRDSEINTPIFESLGIKVGCALDNYVVDGVSLDKSESKKKRKEAYQNLDIVYAKSSTIAFDWEFDQQVMEKEDRMLQRPFHYAIVDEVDSVMIDEANTPLIISQSLNSYEDKIQKEDSIITDKIFGEENRQSWLLIANTIVKTLREDASNTFRSSEEFSSNPILNKVSFQGKHLAGTVNSLQDRILKSGAKIYIDERHKTVELTDAGYDFVGKIIKNTGFDENEVFHYIKNALYAHCILEKDVDYRIDQNSKTNEKKIILIDSNTGRDLPDNKLSEGLHQALEVKEIIKDMPDINLGNKKLKEAIKKVSQMNISTAKITQPSFFSKYQKVGGTSGTVSDEVTKREFKEQYKKKIIEIPRSRKKIAVEKPVEVYASRREKLDAVVSQIIECHKREQPILVGAKDIEEAKEISTRLEAYQRKPFAQLCANLFQTPIEQVNILQATKLYCLMTHTDFPVHDRKAQYAISEQVQCLILPENEKTALDYRVERQLQEKIDSTTSISMDTKKEIYQFLYHKNPESNKELDDLTIRLYGIPFRTLTAENTEQEVEIISQAGRLGAVTIATAIAGRGTDIALGGDPKELARHEVEDIFINRLKKENLTPQELSSKISHIKRQTEMLSRMERCDNQEIQQLFEKKYDKWKSTCRSEKEALEPTLVDPQGNSMHQVGKGLYVLGSSLNDSIRVDNQLRGRSGRQGNDGESKFICSLDDPIIVQNGNQKDLNKIKKVVMENPSSRLAVQYVRAAQRANESIHASIRTDVNRCSKGFDWISDAYYAYREKLLENPESCLPNIFEATSNILFDKKRQEDFGSLIAYFVPLIFNDNEVNNLSNDELKLLFENRTKMMRTEAKNSPSFSFDGDFKRKLLTTGDLKFTLLADDNFIEKQLSLEKMSPNQSANIDDLLDKIVFDKYHDFKDEVILETAITAIHYLKSYLKEKREEKTEQRKLDGDSVSQNLVENIIESTPLDLEIQKNPMEVEEVVSSGKAK